TCLAFSPDGSRLAASARLATRQQRDQRAGVKLLSYDAGTGAATPVRDTPELSRLAWGPDGRHLVFVGTRTGTVWDLKSARAAFAISGGVDNVQAVGFEDGAKRLWFFHGSVLESRSLDDGEAGVKHELGLARGRDGTAGHDATFSGDGRWMAFVPNNDRK